MSIACAISLASMTDAELLSLSTLLVYVVPILFTAAALFGLIRELPHIYSAFIRLYSSQQTQPTRSKEKV